MRFEETSIRGVFLVDLERREDDRGFFARAFCSREFADHGLNGRVAQANISSTATKGALRGMHYQVPPAGEAKLVRCIRGAIWDVVIDMREDSPTYLQHIAVELSADNHRAIYIPEMLAHGNQALTDDVQLFYLVSEFYTPGCERGVRYDDPAVGIRWPLPITVISQKDASWPLLEPRTVCRGS
jgi:dTDP-4-dehydrorhamnose 3,5-epimerase